MNKAATDALRDVDLIVFLVDRTRWTDEDDLVLEQVERARAPVLLAINKIDRAGDKGDLLPFLESVAQKHDFAHVIPVSAKQGHNIERLEALIESFLPESVHFFAEDQITDRSQRFLASELVREKIMRQLGAELPYAVTVQIEEFKPVGPVLHISALILVERDGQKKILIGDQGEKIKIIGRDARKDMETMFDSKVMLNLWVKVKRGWSDDERALKSLGYQHE
jgi:GTP-binding protein Era